MKKLILISLIFISQLANASTGKEDILKVMAMQQDAWNQGDINQYMQGYWQSEELKFGKRPVICV